MQLSQRKRIAFSTYTRLQQWRHREQKRWPGLFQGALNQSEPSHTLTVQKLRTGQFRLLIDDIPSIICDACGGLLKRDRVLNSSESTLPPASQDTAETSIRCPVCHFTMPLGPLRRLMNLPRCGPEFELQVAFSILVEAIGVEACIKHQDSELHSWFLDRGCRMEGMDAMFGVIGIRQEQLGKLPDHTQSSTNVPSFVSIQNMIESERFLKATIPPSILPPIPFSVLDLNLSRDIDKSQVDNEARIVSERTAALVSEAARLWSKELYSDTGQEALTKIHGVGREYIEEQRKARLFNHSELVVPTTVQMTQRLQSQPSGKKTS